MADPPEALEYTTELAIQADLQHKPDQGDVDPEREKQEAIALCKRRIEAAVHLYGEGLIDREEFLRRREANEREMAHWEARTSESEKVALELAMCIEAVDKLAYIWENSSDEDRQGFVRNLFDYVEYDLDARRITDFRLKPWADRFVILRGALYEAEKLESEGEKEPASPGLEVKQELPHRGLRSTSFPKVLFAVMFAIEVAYQGHILPLRPATNGTMAKCTRNDEIKARHAQGESLSRLAGLFGLSAQRVSQIVQSERR